MKYYHLLFILSAFVVLNACTKTKIPFEQLSAEEQQLPEHALASMEVYEGLEVQLFASEPMIANPTNMDIDAKGRVWMIEAQNYRNQHNPDNPYRKTGDRIIILEDTNGDGVADQKKIFYEGEDINAALGIAVLGNKVIVSHSPEVIIFTDENGDDIPDQRETLFSNMSGDQHDHAVHAVVFGPDGRLYFNMGNEGKQIADKEGQFIKDRLGNFINTQDGIYRQGLALRCEMDGSKLEVLGHNFRNPFEIAVDSYGALWQSDNDDDGNRGTRINYVMQHGNYGYTDEMTGAGWRTRRITMHDSISMRHWHLNDPGVVPNLLQTGAGSPTGIVVYEGNLLPNIFHGQMLHCEPGHQVVRSYIAIPDGAGYKAEIVNLLKSKDQWFRPSDVCVAPDGSIFVADWYDPGVGGHKMGDIQRGRIYRIAPKKADYKVPSFDIATPELAVQALQSPNQATRYLAWTALHSMGATAEHTLLALYENGESHLRARAFWLLANINKNYIQKALQNNDLNIQLAAIRAAQYLDESNLLAYLQPMATHENPQIRREIALALRYQMSDEAAILWAALANQYDGQDRWYLEALGIGADLNAQRCFNAWKSVVGKNWNTPANREIVWRLRIPETIPLITEILQDEQLNEKQIAHFFRALHFQPKVNKDSHLAPLLTANHPQQTLINAYTLSNLSPGFYQQSKQGKAIVEALLPTIEGTPEWLDAITSMKLSNQSSALLKMLLFEEDKDMKYGAAKTLIATNDETTLYRLFEQLSAEQKSDFLETIGKVGNKDANQFLMHLMNQNKLPLSLRQTAAASVASNWEGSFMMVEMINRRQLDESLKPIVALKLINAWAPEVKEAGMKILQKDKGTQQLPPIKELVDREGDALAGQYVFKTYCANCHQVNNEGVEFGPNLSEIGAKLSKQALYESIFYPSAGINFGYEGYLIKTKDGNVYNGYITSQTESTTTIRMMGGIDHLIDNSNIASKEAMTQSLMTANLHTIIPEVELVNLVSYLNQLKSPEKERLSIN